MKDLCREGECRHVYNSLKIGYTSNPSIRFQRHSYSTQKIIGAMRFVGCVDAGKEDEALALAAFPLRPGREREIRSGQVDAAKINAIFPGRNIQTLETFDRGVSVAIQPDTYAVLVQVSARTGVKIKVLVEQALRKAYPVKNGAKAK